MASEDDGRIVGDEDHAVRAGQDHGESMGDPDLQLDVPVLNVEEIDLEVQDLRVRLSVQAELADLVKINIGLDAELGEAKLGIKGVEAQAQLKARLDNVRAIFSEVVASLQHGPQFFRQTPEQRTEGGGEPDATSAAIERAEQLGVDLSGIEGTGSGGRIVVRDVTQAAEG
ncbi:MAG: E3 binding domain-containing protein [Rubrobacteraceae bacterium]|nr:E3 binding domain-containing protein [Rubrobacteraceae bacterium]